MFLALGAAVVRNVVLRIRMTWYKGNRCAKTIQSLNAMLLTFTSVRDGLPIQHKITTFERNENTYSGPNRARNSSFSTPRPTY